MSDWIDVIIETETDAGELLGQLDDPDVTGAWQENGTVHLYWPVHRWTSDSQRRLEALLQMPVTVRRLPAEDWNVRWLAHGTIALLSGILVDDRDDLASAYAGVGAAIRSSRGRDGWLAIELVADRLTS